MQFKKYTKQVKASIQGLRSFKDTLPKNVKKIINKRGHIYSETINNWKYIVGENLFKVCYPKSFKNSNKFGVSTLLIMIKRGHEVDMEYSKKEIIDRMNNFFGYVVVEKLKFTSFDNKNEKPAKEKGLNENIKFDKNKATLKDEAISEYKKKINSVNNENIKKSLVELSKVFKKR